MFTVEVKQVDGLSLVLAVDSSELWATLSGGGLVAHTSAALDADALSHFFTDTATGTRAPWGRWEYKSYIESVVLLAEPDTTGGVLLTVNLLTASSDKCGQCDWEVNGTLLVSLADWQQATAAIVAVCNNRI